MSQHDDAYVYIKQHLSNIWSSVYEKVKQHWDWVEKKRCFKKCVYEKTSERKEGDERGTEMAVSWNLPKKKTETVSCDN